MVTVGWFLFGATYTSLVVWPGLPWPRVSTELVSVGRRFCTTFDAPGLPPPPSLSRWSDDSALAASPRRSLRLSCSAESRAPPRQARGGQRQTRVFCSAESRAPLRQARWGRLRFPTAFYCLLFVAILLAGNGRALLLEGESSVRWWWQEVGGEQPPADFQPPLQFPLGRGRFSSEANAAQPGKSPTCPARLCFLGGRRRGEVHRGEMRGRLAPGSRQRTIARHSRQFVFLGWGLLLCRRCPVLARRGSAVNPRRPRWL